jgi:dolichol-phosphate mannosyltransferase
MWVWSLVYTTAMLHVLFGKFAIFCMVGAVSTLIDISLLYALVEFASLPVLLSATISLTVASINGYILNKRLTFKDHSTRYARQYISYLFVSCIGLLLTLGILAIGIHIFNMHYLFAKIIAVVLVTSWNFSVNYLLVFTHTRP